MILGQIAFDIFPHPARTTDLEESDFNVLLLHNGVSSAEEVTFSDLGNGDYGFSFLPNAVGSWVLRVVVGGIIGTASFDVQEHPLLATKADVDMPGTAGGAIFDGAAVAKNPITQPAFGEAGAFAVKDDDGTTDRWTGTVNAERTERTLD